VKNQPQDRMKHEQAGPARGWTNEVAFARGGRKPKAGDEALRVIVLNPEIGTGSSAPVRRALLHAAIERAGDSGPTLIVTPAGFFGCSVDAEGDAHWPGNLDITALEHELADATRAWPSSLMVAVGVDVHGHDQRQWWFAGGEGRRRCEVLRASDERDATPLDARVVTHAGYTLLGFVCGEGYEWHEGQLTSALSDVDVVVVSAHVEVNRIWDREIDPGLKRWAFQRRFQLIAGYAGAALAHARGPDETYVRNCDDWFVHRGGDPFPGPRVGVPITANANIDADSESATST